MSASDYTTAIRLATAAGYPIRVIDRSGTAWRVTPAGLITLDREA